MALEKESSIFEWISSMSSEFYAMFGKANLEFC